jgi:hypothetical protein
MTTIDRFNTVVRESTQTAFEAAAAVQRQNVQLFQTWIGTLEANQQIARELTLRTLGQVQEAQRLWADLVQETVRTSVENVTNLTETQLREASRQAAANGSRIEVPTA